MEKLSEQSHVFTDRELVVTRLLNAPRERVFEAWTDPKHLVHWWGPKGFTNTFHEIDVRPGGAWRFIMHGPDGVDYPNRVVFEEIVKPERISYHHGSDIDDDPDRFYVQVTFEAQGEKTKITLRSRFASAEALQNVLQFGALEGAHETLERLEAQIALMVGEASNPDKS